MIGQCVNQRCDPFLDSLKSADLSSLIDEYTAFQNNVDREYKFVCLSWADSWKRKSALKKAEKMRYLNEQLFGPLLCLLNQFASTKILDSVHFTYFLSGTLPGSRRVAKRPKYWSAELLSSTMDTVCHFIQKEGGTGVHLQNGYVLSCAHVIAADTDPDEEGEGELDAVDRIGRIKYVVFANGAIYKTECVAVNEEDDLSLLRIEWDSEIKLIDDDQQIGTAVLAETAPKIKCHLFCIGNPSNIDLEDGGVFGDTDFEPKIFHLSFGRLRMMKERGDGLGEYGHDCWTYWGHSGAPIFNEEGEVVALHNSWDDRNGMRHAVRWEKIQKFMAMHTTKE